MNKKIIAAVGVITLGCLGMLIWAWRSGDSVLVIVMGVALVLICGVGVLPVVFNAKGLPKTNSKADSAIVVRDEGIREL